MTDLKDALADCPAIATFVDAVTASWPEHARFVSSNMARHASAELDVLELVAKEIRRLIGSDLESHCDDYRWLCETFLEEEIHFRRSGEYRLQSFDEAQREVYSNTTFMARYMSGLLVSQLLWPNHANTIVSFQRDFLPMAPASGRYLEIGPGHGLFVALAARSAGSLRLSAWDVSEESLDQTRRCLTALDLADRVVLDLRDVQNVSATGETFDSIVINEVLEHLDDPLSVLRALHALTAPGGNIFVGMPVNSPAPDHVYLLRHPDEVLDLVRQAGYEPLATHNFPGAGYSLERALAASTTISCIVIGRKT